MYILLKETYNVGNPQHGPETFAQIIAPPLSEWTLEAVQCLAVYFCIYFSSVSG